jgi:RNA polymerase sigma-70 factor (ECF subfamily)
MVYLEDADDEKLLALLKNGDSKSFEVLYQRYHKRVYAYALKLLPSTQDAEEIVQNVFLAVWNQRNSLDFVSSFNLYIFGIVRHLVYRFIKQKVNYEAYAAYVLYSKTEYAFVTDDDVAYKELEQLYNKLIEQLPERRKEIFLLSRKYNLSYREISERLNISENTIDTQIRLALGFIKTELGKALFIMFLAFLP